jgi:uncharacterized HhH-GPD family protein
MDTPLRPERLPFTGDDEADRLLAHDPMALLIGFVLDQQVTVQKAFMGPLEIRRRIGTLDADRIASMPPDQLEEAFRQRPTIHRFPANMARRTQALCAFIAERYGGDARRIWSEAADAADLRQRLLELPGIGAMKTDSLLAILGKRFGIEPPGWDEVAPTRPTLGDVDSPEALVLYQEDKRARKRALRSQG